MHGKLPNPLTSIFQQLHLKDNACVYAAMPLHFESIEKWQDLFSSYTLAEVRALRHELQSRAGAKKRELRGLIGSRYADLIKIAGQIIKMERVVIDEDDKLASLCKSERTSRQCFSDKIFSLEQAQHAAVERLLKSLKLALRYETNSQSNWPLVGRMLLLAEQLHGDVKSQRQQVEKVVRQVLLDGSGTKTDPDSVLGALTCYMILTQKSPSATLEDLVSARTKAVKRVISQHSTASLVQALKLCSSSLQLVETAFSRKRIHRLITQQAETFSLLTSPDIVESPILNIDKYHQWLPEAVRSYPSFPPECTKSMQPTKGHPSEESQKLYASRYAELARSMVSILTDAVSGILHDVASLVDLVDLLRNILEMFRDIENLRQLHDTQDPDKLWLTFVFIPAWVKRGKEILKAEIERISYVHGLVETQVDKATRGSFNDSIFSSNSVLGMPRLALKDLESIFETLDSAVQGRVGTVRPVTEELDRWKLSVERCRDSIQDTIKLKSILSSSEKYDIEEWKTEVEQCIERGYKELKKQEMEILDCVRENMVSFLLNITEQKRQQAAVYVLLIRSQLYMDRLVVDLAPQSVTPEASKKLLNKCYQGIARELTSGLANIYVVPVNTATWLDQEPVTPSLDILASLTKLVQNVIDILGSDDLVLGYREGVSALRTEIASAYFHLIEEEKSRVVADERTDEEADKTEEKSEDRLQVSERASEKAGDQQQDCEQKVQQGGCGKNGQDEETQHADGAQQIKRQQHVDSRQTNLQFAMDTIFVSKLFNVEAPSLHNSFDIQRITQYAEENATRTRLLFHPFSVTRPIDTQLK